MQSEESTKSKERK